MRFSEENDRYELSVLERVLDHANTINDSLREQLRYNAMLNAEDLGWARVIGGGVDIQGPSLADVKEWSAKLRESLGNVHMQKGLRLRTNNIWSAGIHYNDDALPSGSGHKVQTAKRVKDPLNVRNFFGAQAHAERESACYTDGIFMVLGDPSDFTLDQVSIEEIGSVAYHPRKSDEIIAYRIDGMDYSGEEPVQYKEWHYTDLAIGRRDQRGFGIKLEPGETAPDEKVIFDQMVNTQVGWAFGAPDALAAYAWAKVYRDFVMNGKVMSDAMSQFAFQVATGTKKESDTAAARLAEPSDAGATLVGANTLVPLATAGKGYDFGSGRSLLAIVASALEVSVIALSADASGADAAAANNLDLPTRLAMESRQQLHAELDFRVLVWMGADIEKLKVTFTSLEDGADIYRELQALILALNSGLYKPEPIEKRISELLEITGNSVPTDWLSPNTLKTLKAQAKVKADSTPAPTQNSDAGGEGDINTTTAAPTQGKNSPAGKSGDNGNDIRGGRKGAK